MTSLTTIFAMVPLLFSSDMGSELQKPLSNRHDRHDVHRYGGQPLYHTVALLVYLSGKKRESTNQMKTMLNYEEIIRSFCIDDSIGDMFLFSICPETSGVGP